MNTQPTKRKETMKYIITRTLSGLAILVAFFAILVFIIAAPAAVRAEEGGSGHYMPGATASFVDGLPGKPGLAVANFFTYYNASADVSRQLPFGGLVTSGLDATAYADTVAALYRTPLTILGGYYVVGLAVPYVWMEVKGEVQFTGPRGNTFTKTVKDSANGFGDITVYPFMLGWTALGGDLKYDVRFGVYVPTGEYNKGYLANVGKNYWTFEPTVSFSYISSKIGLELSAFSGVDFNTKNNDTEYQTGDQFHLDVTVAEHLPLLGGLIGVGVNGFYYQQISGDSGSGAVLGDFKGRTAGIGPVLSYVTKVWKKDLVAEVKWLAEIDVGNRLKGDYIWFKLAMQF
jgi:hypothetical protein